MRTVDEQKKFCDSCQHHVIDFTKAESNQLAMALQSNNRVCGRFKRSQMSESVLKYAATVVVASSVAIGCSPTEEPVQTQEVTQPMIEKLLEDFLTGIVIYDSAKIEELKKIEAEKGRSN